MLPFACSIAYNGIGDEGASALAAVLKETQIQKLECAAAPERSLFCQCPLTHTCPLTVPPPIPRSIGNNRIGAEGASALAAILKETQITTLECATPPQIVRFCVNAH